MEIIARFPALPDDRDTIQAVVVPEPRPVRDLGTGEADGHVPRATRPPRRRPKPGAGFPFRSVLALSVVAAVAWALALKSDAARRQQARLAQAAAGSVAR